MFTGIVEEVGEVVRLERLADDAARLVVRGPRVTADTRRGDSVAVDGTCLTVTDLDGETFTADVMGETLRRTGLGQVTPGTPVNLERATALGGRLGGHLVQGHVDGTGTLLDRTAAEHWHLVRISLPPALVRYVVEKGSVAVDGVSLTVVSVDDTAFTVGLVPATLAATTLGRKVPGDRVNLEVDLVAKYVERLVAWRQA